MPVPYLPQAYIQADLPLAEIPRSRELPSQEMNLPALTSTPRPVPATDSIASPASVAGAAPVEAGTGDGQGLCRPTPRTAFLNHRGWPCQQCGAE
jgi:hypothetical protein